MSVQIPTALAAQIVAEANATDGSLRALDGVAREHGLLLAELKQLMAQNAPQLSKTPAATSTPVAGRPARRALPLAAPGRTTPQPEPEPAEVETTRVCSKCDVEQPIENYYEQSGGRGGRMAHCMTCNNKRRPTENRMVRNRARSRAYAELAKRHALEFAELFDAELEKAREEHVQVQAAAGEQHDAKVARLRPGPKRRGQTSATDRLDVARCPSCQTHHDADHECPSCGDVTPETPVVVKPWVVREWAIEAGIEVPTRGPIPDAVQTAYDEAHASEAVPA